MTKSTYNGAKLQRLRITMNPGLTEHKTGLKQEMQNMANTARIEE
jgi:hypothetical protein